MHILIIKTGALGDVVRTAYFARYLYERQSEHLRISWYTLNECVPLLRFNPFIEDIWTDPSSLATHRFDHVYSLDDERNCAAIATATSHVKLTGAYVDDTCVVRYTDDAACWFDMGLISKHGKDSADQLKRANLLGHAEIFSRIFDTAIPHPNFFGRPIDASYRSSEGSPGEIRIGINPFAGARWPSKALPKGELLPLLRGLDSALSEVGLLGDFRLFGAGTDYARNLETVQHCSDLTGTSTAVDTSSSLLRFAAEIKDLDILISSDSLALHLAISQMVPFVAFFTATSATEIDSFGLGKKVLSTSPDYCSYSPHADNSSITWSRLLEAVKEVLTSKAIVPHGIFYDMQAEAK